jgi:hypothetical protein
MVFPVRVQCFLEGRDFEAFDPDAQGTASNPSQSPADIATRFAQCRTASLELLKEVRPKDFSRTARHAVLGLVTLAEMFHEWAGHDLMHTVQAERALMQPFIDGCGPWRFYFADHEIKQREA